MTAETAPPDELSVSTGPVRPSADARTALRPVARARITGGFWAARRRTNADISIPQGPRLLEDAGNLANLRAAADGTGEFAGDFPFQDSDVHKWLEAASWQLAENPADEELTADVEALTSLLAAAQDADGYLQTYYQVAHPERRWQELDWGHELYCAGHLVQAAVAHHRATGRTGLLDIARRFAEHIDTVFGPGRPVDGVCGHPEIETALVELYRETRERRWLDLASYFVERRGHGLLGDGAKSFPGAGYWQDHVPVREARTVTGHAVRQLYLLAGVTDLAAETGDDGLRETAVRLWEAMTESKTYLTGGLGSRHELESFGDPHELPPDRAYNETCAAIASVQWSWRLALLTGEARYSDLIERTLFNGFAAGCGLDGDSWLYVNPLQVREEYEGHRDDQSARRTPWFRCACCPPNAMRLLASLPYYVATTDDDGVQLHQYATGRYGPVSVETGYPWDGRIAVTAEESGTWTLSLRIPAWCSGATLDGEPVTAEACTGGADTGRAGTGQAGTRGAATDEQGTGAAGWLRVRREWRTGERVVLDLAVRPRLTHPDPRVDAVRGCAAVEFGPLVYCLESADQPRRLDEVLLDASTALAAEHRPGLLGGVTVVTAGDLIAVPYAVWANRGAGAMRVWIPLDLPPVPASGAGTGPRPHRPDRPRRPAAP
ncbi:MULTISPECIES: glycoside hydrolase family 127 protein [unclassified Streptomyces]|uniref:glycoside hydrolase family 127 protein n=1 Tax=unclassified Streptomyces TaxID=2593676 RepID=UPI0009A1065F|nr:beta-L-arabinofuranosidase domain-containing protein [Streptomyces sp. CB02058]